MVRVLAALAMLASGAASIGCYWFLVEEPDTPEDFFFFFYHNVGQCKIVLVRHRLMIIELRRGTSD